MALTDHEQFGLYPAVFDALVLSNVRDVSPSSNTREAILTAGGSIDPGQGYEISREPVVRLTTPDIGQVLASVSVLNGFNVSSSSLIQYRKRLDGGDFDPNPVHTNLLSNKGHLMVTDIGATFGAEEGAQVGLEYHALKVGSNAPLRVQINQALTGTPSVVSLYRLGPTVFEGVSLGGVKSSKFATGLRYETTMAGPQTAPSQGVIRARRPSFDVQVENLTVLNSVGFGSTGLVSGFTQYFEKVDAGPTDPVHIAIGFSAGRYTVRDANVAGDGDASVSLAVTRIAGSLTVSTTATLP